MNRYAGDSFFTLTQGGQAGLVLLSAVLCVLMLWVTRHMTSGRPWWARLLFAVLAFMVFVWLSPQIYYTYYGFLFDDLPGQWVIKSKPSDAPWIAQLLFSGHPTLANHGLGLLGWAMIAVALLPKRNPSRV